MLSPIAAPRMAARIITGSGIRPAAADTPPRMTAISPGNTNPMNADDSRAGSRKTASSTAQPGSSSKRSGIDAVIVGQRIHPRPRVRALRPKEDESSGHDRDAAALARLRPPVDQDRAEHDGRVLAGACTRPTTLTSTRSCAGTYENSHDGVSGSDRRRRSRGAERTLRDPH